MFETSTATFIDPTLSEAGILFITSQISTLTYLACIVLLKTSTLVLSTRSSRSLHRDTKFWDFHKRKLAETVGLIRTHLTGAILARLSKAVLNPYDTSHGWRQAKTRREAVRRSTPSEFDRSRRAIQALRQFGTLEVREADLSNGSPRFYVFSHSIARRGN